MPPALIGSPYKSPPARTGKIVYDVLHGDLIVEAISDAPIPWPLVRPALSTPSPIPAVTPELKRAIQMESVEAIVYHWGVSRWTVRRWRHALKVPRFNPGTTQLWRKLAAGKLDGHRPGASKHALSLDRRAELARRARAGESGAALAKEYGVSRQYVGQLRFRAE